MYYIMLIQIKSCTCRSKSLEECMKTLSDPNATEGETTKAKKNMDALNEVASREDGLENLIRNKGYRDVVVYTKNGRVDVVVPHRK